ncbi:hypothetical protein [Streptomyces mirabilis]|uniref:hypothetical protein n=1 Tax=Streptomyces mirabilis TaxID=68239 RepID=UPI0036D9F1C4
MNFVKTHPARIYAAVVAVLGLVAAFGIDVPSAQILGAVAAVLGLAGGEVVQRVENGKTFDALLTPSPAHSNLADQG